MTALTSDLIRKIRNLFRPVTVEILGNRGDREADMLIIDDIADNQWPKL